MYILKKLQSEDEMHTPYNKVQTAPAVSNRERERAAKVKLHLC